MNKKDYYFNHVVSQLLQRIDHLVEEVVSILKIPDNSLYMIFLDELGTTRNIIIDLDLECTKKPFIGLMTGYQRKM